MLHKITYYICFCKQRHQSIFWIYFLLIQKMQKISAVIYVLTRSFLLLYDSISSLNSAFHVLKCFHYFIQLSVLSWSSLRHLFIVSLRSSSLFMIAILKSLSCASSFFSQGLLQWSWWLLDTYYLRVHVYFLGGIQASGDMMLGFFSQISGLVFVRWMFCSLVGIAQYGSQPNVVAESQLRVATGGSLKENVFTYWQITQWNGDELEGKNFQFFCIHFL